MIYADLVIKNGKVATVDRDFSYQEAVAVKDGWIIDVGSNEEISLMISPDTQVIDLAGKVLLPAACDAHMHATLTGYTMGPDFINVGTPDIKTVKDIQEKIKQAIDRAEPGQWIYGSGFLEFMLQECMAEGRGLNRWDLDPVSPDNPVFLTDFGLHTMVANSKALEIAGIDENYFNPQIEYGKLERDSSGVPNGRLNEWSAHHLVGKHCPAISEEGIEACILAAQEALNKEGITNYTDFVGSGVEQIFLGVSREKSIEVYERMFNEGKLTARASLIIYPCVDGVESYNNIIEALDQMPAYEFADENWVKADAIKIFCDQGLWLRAEEGRPDGAGRSVFPGKTNEEQAADITKTIIELHRRGWQVCAHAIGGKAIDTTVDAYIKAQQMYPDHAPRHYVIHGDDMTLDNAAKMARYHIGCSPQPIAANIVGGLRVGVMTAKEELFDWQAYMDRGVIVAGGSDAPCFSFNWRQGVQFAVTRTTAAGQAIRPDLSMKLEDAIRMYTIEGAKQENLERVRGSIEANKVADFQVLDRDIFTCDKSEIGNISVEMTICAGKVVYKA